MSLRKTRFHYDETFPAAETRLTLLSDRNFAPHYHREFSVGAVLENQVRVGWNGGSALIAPGEVVIVDPMTVHSCNTVDGGPRSYCMIYLDAEFCASLIPQGTRLFRDGRLDLLRDPNLFMEVVKLNALLTETSISPKEKEEALRGFLPRLAEARTAAVHSPERSRARKPAATAAAKLIAEQAFSGLPLDELGEALGVSKYHLVRVFRNSTDLPPHRFLLNHRINEAKRLLRRSSIADAALDAGFYDQSHFTRTFVSMTAATPGEYRSGVGSP